MSSRVWLFIPGVDPCLWTHQITAKRRSIGRSDDCDIQLAHGSVSRRHAEVWRADDVLWVKDLESRNGTRRNGSRVREKEIEVGDTLHFGDVAVGVGEEVKEKPASADGGLSATTIEGRIQRAARFEVRFGGLSDAQLKVLQPLLKGLSEKQIADALFVSQHTVHSHIKQIYRVMGVQSRPELMALYLSQMNKQFKML
jgi:DNA-binding CsgD family transcriptional regulator